MFTICQPWEIPTSFLQRWEPLPVISQVMPHDDWSEFFLCVCVTAIGWTETCKTGKRQSRPLFSFLAQRLDPVSHRQGLTRFPDSLCIYT